MNQDTLAAEGHGIELVIPDRATMQRFTIFANDSLEQIAMLEQQIQNLRRTATCCSPLLLSGQLDVEALPESGVSEFKPLE